MKLLQALPNATDCFMTVGVVFLSAFIIVYFYIDYVLLFCYNITLTISVS